MMVNSAMRSFEEQWQRRSIGLIDTARPIQSLQEQAMRRFVNLGLPSARDESWRNTSLRQLAASHFGDALDVPCAPRLEPIEISWLAASDIPTIIMVNGYPQLAWLDRSVLNGVSISTIKDIAKTRPGYLINLLEPLSDLEQRRWLLLNSALFVDGLHLKITAKINTPVLIIHVSSGNARDGVNAPISNYPRVIIESAKNSSATVIEHHVGASQQSVFSNSVSHLDVEDNAKIQHYRIFSTDANTSHIDSLDIRLGRDSHCQQFTMILGGGLVRTNLEAELNQPGAALENYSLLVGRASRHIDCVNIVRHNARNTTSKQTARAVASDESRVIINSKVVVEVGAQHSESQQSCRGLLLSPKAEIDTRPQLEIHTDEVKCAHGATTGRLDPDMLFYMLSRGLDRNTAQSLLVYAFLGDVLTNMSVVGVRSAIENVLIGQLPNSQLLREFQ